MNKDDVQGCHMQFKETEGQGLGMDQTAWSMGEYTQGLQHTVLALPHSVGKADSEVEAGNDTIFALISMM